MGYERIDLEVTDGVAVLTLNDPKTRNALSWTMAEEMGRALDDLGNARALVITGAGKGFCSGGDMSATPAEGSDFGEMLYQGLAGAVNPMLLKLSKLKIPVIAAVNGAAAGAGAPLACWPTSSSPARARSSTWPFPTSDWCLTLAAASPCRV
jgi:2-(1,2-epoxy-1,2-dihydrophenyl)acetyl-CoA isomerase